MHGNIWKWVEDPWHPSYSKAPVDGSVWLTGGSVTERVVRGGSWYDIPDFLRSADRSKQKKDSRDGAIGFRITRALMR